MVVVDPLGSAFGALRELGLAVSLWRVLDSRRLPALSSVDLAVLAVYDRIDWSVADALVERAPTLAISTNYSRDDATASLFLTVPLYLLYEFSILLSRIVFRKRQQADANTLHDDGVPA